MRELKDEEYERWALKQRIEILNGKEKDGRAAREARDLKRHGEYAS